MTWFEQRRTSLARVTQKDLFKKVTFTLTLNKRPALQDLKKQKLWESNRAESSEINPNIYTSLINWILKVPGQYLAKDRFFS